MDKFIGSIIKTRIGLRTIHCGVLCMYKTQVYACVDWLKSNAVKVIATPTKRDAGHDVYDATAAVMEKIGHQGPTQSASTGDNKVAGAAASSGVSAAGGRSHGAAAAAAPKRNHRGPPVRVRRRGKARPPRRKKTPPNQATAVSPALRVAHQRAQQQFMRHLMRYDKLLEKERFDVHEHECESCYDEKPGRSCV